MKSTPNNMTILFLLLTSFVWLPIASASTSSARIGPDFADLIESVSESVVSVRVYGKVRDVYGSPRSFGFNELPPNHPWRRFFEDRWERRNAPDSDSARPDRPTRPISQGSGFFVSADGYIVTNEHVVRNGDSYEVVMHDGEELDAELVGVDPKTDLAVLKVEGEFSAVTFSDDRARVGEWVIAVGNPFGLGGTVTAGIVSADGRDIGSGPYDDFIQIDAAVNRGNSGGPTFNLLGEVIGVNTAIYSPSGGNVGIAFAISSDTARSVVSDLISEGHVSRGWLGVRIQPVTPDIASALDIESRGALVSSVESGSPASAGGLIEGDIILSIDDEVMEDAKDVSRRVASLGPDRSVDLTLWRGGEEVRVSVTLGLHPDHHASLGVTNPDDNQNDSSLGLSFGIRDNNVVISGIDDRVLGRGVEIGDIVVSVNGVRVDSVDETLSIISSARSRGNESVLLQFRSEVGSRFVVLPFFVG